ncbi:Long-chain-fatty-acid--CoA ligase ACSBG2 (Acyl-CoA synthetase bubblegum family member 2) (Arachidonate--CoA ligase ACSBG2) [Durusdinium trenchii]|uniref:Long-chain-fatty-acid--CoA ligase ACSBG2 (Acyl-CoA synthetase bubblegum family member 2) (Arachidonate--CoA ligase ACSBG2) n=1 Tax=Durusdinium trenchii TaxID=1381693 RepID=A0ABP0QVQ6_9DINO
MPVPLKRAPLNKPSELSKYEPGSGPFWTCESDGEKNVLFAETGVASEAETPSVTLIQYFDKAVKRRPNKVAMRTENMPALKKGEEIPEPIDDLKQWKSWTWKQYKADCRKMAKAMIAVGMEQHDAVNIFGFNSPEWFIGMMGAIFAGGKAAGIYPSDGEDQVQYKSFHSNASVAIVENEECFNKFANVIEDLPYLKSIVCWAMPSPGNITREDGSVVEVYTFAEFIQKGAAIDESTLDERIAQIKPTHACALIYTSGTTGRPKAVMISHDNLAFESSSVLPIASVGLKNEEDRIISYLPLSHVAGMMVDVVCPIIVTAKMKGWLSVSFARPYDLKAGSLGKRLASVKPTLFLGVPRVWEKIAEKLQAIGAQTKGLKKKLSTTAKARGLQAQMAQQIGRDGFTPSFGPFGIYKILLKVIKKKLGLNKCKFAFAGAAPMTREILSYFGSLGININEVYGMSECTGATTWSTDAAHEWGTVGFETPGAEVRCFKVNADGSKTLCPLTKNILNPSEEEQGELCYRGRHIMMGYMANPKLGDDHVAEIEKKNADAIDEEGWLHSGDKGAISHLGMVRITGRYKELIIGAGGENIAPVPIEDALKKEVPAISNVMMVGDKRKFNVILISLKCEGATGELPGGDILDGPAKAFGSTIEGAIKSGKIVDEISAALKRVGDDSEVTPSNAARIQKFTILPQDFSVMTGELTATLKLKRSVVADKYADIIEALYDSSETFVPYSEVGTYDVKALNDPVPEGSFKAAGNLEMVDSGEVDEEALEAAEAEAEAEEEEEEAEEAA